MVSNEPAAVAMGVPLSAGGTIKNLHKAHAIFNESPRGEAVLGKLVVAVKVVHVFGFTRKIKHLSGTRLHLVGHFKSLDTAGEGGLGGITVMM